MNNPTNWRDYLVTDFQTRKSKNPGFSLRTYAKLLGVSPAHLSLILSGKRKLKAKSALRIAKSLGMTSTETLSLLDGETSPNRNYETVRTKVLQDDEFNLISSWHYYAILGLANIQPNMADPQWIATKLGIPLNVAKKSFQNLLDLNYLEIAKGQFRQIPAPLRTADDIPSESVRNYHKQTLQLAAEKIDRVQVEDREYTSMTLAINPNKVNEAKKMIRKFKEDFMQEITRGKTSEVYSINIQFFPLTEPDPLST